MRESFSLTHMAFSGFPITASSDAQAPLAYIDSEDETFVQPIREYLEQYGCRVVINTSLQELALYHIVCGSGDFVKSILSATQKQSNKTFLIIWDALSKIDETNFSLSGKIALVDAHVVHRNEIHQLFQFFFTSNQSILSLRKEKGRANEPHRPVQSYQNVKPEADMFHEKKITKAIDESAQLSNSDRQRISQLIADVFQPSSQSSKQQIKNIHKRTSVISIFFALLIIILLPILLYIFSVGVSAISFAIAAKTLRDGKTGESRNFRTIGSLSLSLSLPMFRILALPSLLVSEEQFVRGQERMLSFLKESELSLVGIDSLFSDARVLGTSLLSPLSKGVQGTSPSIMIEKVRSQVHSVQTQSGLAQSQLSELLDSREFPFSVSFIFHRGEKVLDAFIKLRETVGTMEDLLTIYPNASGFKSPQTFLLLFQNSMELRPTGGFIGSVGVLELANGSMSELAVRDVYELDGQLKGHVDPPRPIREILGQEHWYLRDSNWDPDFAVSGQKAAWFYEKETGKTVEGVIGVSIPFLVELLKATGPILLPDYNDRITSDNFYGKALFYTRTDFFPGSTQKKDFLGTLARAIIDKLTSAKGADPVTVFRAVQNALDGHNLLFYFTDPKLLQLSQQYGWSGVSQTNSSCDPSPKSCFADSVGVIEANLGVNKSNYFVDGSLLLRVTIDGEGAIEESITQISKNTSSPQDQNGGTYKTYTRFYLSQTATISSILLDGTPIPTQGAGVRIINLPYQEAAEKSTEAMVYAVAHETSPGSAHRITVSYSHGKPLQFEQGKAMYRLLIAKQAGLEGRPVTIKIQYPPSWDIHVDTGNRRSGEPGMLATEGELEYNTILSQDIPLAIVFSK